MINRNMIILMVLLMLGIVGSVTADALISHWEFNEDSGMTTADSVDGNNATLVNTEGDEWTTSNCKVGVPVFEFDGVDDYLYVPYNANLDSGDGGEFTIAFWMKAPEPQQSEIMRMGTSNTQGGTYSGKRWAISIDNNGTDRSRIIFTVDDGTNERTLTSFVDIDFTQWHYFVFRRYTQSYKLLNIVVDDPDYMVGMAGALFPPNPPTGDLVETGEDLYIGCKGPDENYEGNFKGQLADIRYYDYLTSGDTMVAVMAETSSTLPSCPNPDDGAENVPLNTALFWEAPVDANEFWFYDVYIDTDSDLSDVSPITVIGGTAPNVTNSELGTLTAGNYWWRVDAIDPNGPTIRTGDVWTFNAGVALPALVNPPDGTGSYGLELLLQWDSDLESGLIEKHRIILNNITDGTTDSTEKLAAQEDYYLGNPDMWDIVFYDKDYTWQVIELGAGDEVLAVGPEWRFSTLALQCGGLSVDADVTGDCKIKLDDIAVIASGWLECGWQLQSGPVSPSDKDPCLW